jgi:hypothetical protein
MQQPLPIHAVIVGLITLASGAFVSPASANEVGAQPDRLATCNVTDVRISLSPGITVTPGKGTFTTHGPTGKLECRGFIQGREITGPGTFAEEGVWEGDCSGGTAASTISVALQTSDGPLTVSFPVKIMFRPGWGWKWSDTLVGPLVFQYYPTRGDCLNAPVTEILCSGQALVKS